MNTLMNSAAVGVCLAVTLGKAIKVTMGEKYEEETGIETKEASEGGEESITVCSEERTPGYDCQSY